MRIETRVRAAFFSLGLAMMTGGAAAAQAESESARENWNASWKQSGTPTGHEAHLNYIEDFVEAGGYALIAVGGVAMAVVSVYDQLRDRRRATHELRHHP